MPNKTDEGQGVTFTDEQQAHIDKIIGAARIKEREKFDARLATDTAKATSDAEEAKLRADEAWDALDVRNKERIAELEPFEAKAKAFDAYLETELKAKVKALGAEAKKTYTAFTKEMSVQERLGWLVVAASEGLFGETSTGPVGSPKKRVKRGGVADKSPADYGHRRSRM